MWHRACPVLVFLAAAVAAHARLVPAQSHEPDLPRLLADAADYVDRFEQAFATMVGDERYEQRARSQFVTARETQQRTILSEMLFVWVPEQQSWITARNVRSVDGAAVADSDTRLERLLTDTSSSWLVRVRRLRDEGARFNIGRIQRNFSDPTMVLQFLNARIQPRFAFALQGRDEIGGVVAWKIAYRELTRPTLVRSSGRDVAASGEIWIAARDNAVVRTRVALEDVRDTVRLKANVDVTYRLEPRFGIWIPEQMHETYEERGRGTYRGAIMPFENRVDCVATYSNFQRFETEARLVPR